MAHVLLQIDFPFSGPWGQKMVNAMKPLAEDIAAEPDLLWKIWTTNEATGEAGGIYLFSNDDALECYLEKHTKRLEATGIRNIRARRFDVVDGLTKITRGSGIAE